MTIADILKKSAIRLQPKRIVCHEDRNLGRLEAEILLAHTLERDRAWLIGHANETITPAKLRQFTACVQRRTKHEPIAHIIGEKEFYGRTFLVNKHVLIPRPETELFIDIIDAPSDAELTIWDVGTGSGAIATTLALKYPTSTVLATDISQRALAVAKQNAKRLGAKNISFLKSDLLQPAAFRWLKHHATASDGLIVCANLPYLPESDKKKLEPDVTQFEPSRALFSGTDGLDLIRRFLGQLSRHLSDWGYAQTTILLEYDPPQTIKLTELAKTYFPEAIITIHKDLAGRERVMEIQRRPYSY